MNSRHASSFGEVFATSGQLFIDLSNFKEQLEKWIAPALVDLESYMEHRLSEPEDWDKAFQIAKKKKEELFSLARYLTTYIAKNYYQMLKIGLYNINVFIGLQR